MRGVFLLLGTNLGDREQNLLAALQWIEKEAGKIAAQSSIFETASWGIHEQPSFLNQAVKIETSLTPEQLLNKILAIELKMGRERMEKWGSRLIDIDILFYDNLIVDAPGLRIPHPEFKKRNFALFPMAEIAPEETHPETTESMATLKLESKDLLPVRVYE